MPSGGGFTSVKLGHHDTVAPNPVTQTNFHWYSGQYTVSMQWPAALDDPNGIGVWAYQVNGWAASFVPSYEDTNAGNGGTNTYTIVVLDYHGNTSAPFTFNASALPSNALDPRRTGVMTVGSYYGSGGEQIDVRSGNANFSLPLLQPQGRTGWSVPLSLSYNSQNWTHAAGANWETGWDDGNGFGWSLSFGSIAPYQDGNQWYQSYNYVFTDGTGARYPLDSGQVLPSTLSSYVWYDPVANVLHFKDGTFWVMGCTSGGTEPDAGTLYPTLIEDPNGNQIFIAYEAGANVSGPNSSSRIATIEDVRGKGSATYTFSWNN